MQAIAIIGMSCRLPGANSPKALWRMLCQGKNAIGDVPPSRWNSDRFFNADPKQIGKMYTKRGGFLNQEQIECFDAHCFGISPREALHMDPQQRIMLELAWEVFEDAGIPHRRLAGSATGVYFGFGAMEYALTQLRYPNLIDAYTNTGYFPSIISNRVSYTFDLRGPSVSLDTACSSSLVAVHLACESLRKGESNLALAGGVCLMIDPVTSVAFCKLSALSPDGQCKTFDESANGYVRGEGAGIVLLKRLEDAIADGDRIYATILGEAVNQDGKSNGLTAPNRLAQEEVLKQAYASAGYQPSHVQYIEAHGTGTFLGDPIELNAIGNVTREGRPSNRNLLVGSLKTNIGHLEAAAGVAGLIKLAMCVQNATIPPHLNFCNPNPHIPFAALKTEVVTKIRDWPAHDGLRTAGISAFGFGGTNAHVVVSEASASVAATTADSGPTSITDDNARLDVPAEPSILLMSTRDPQATQQLKKQYQDFLAVDGSESSWTAICQASALNRSHLEYRSSIVASHHNEAIELLSQRISKEPEASKARNRPKCAFLFSGQGSQYFQMGYQLYCSQPVFRKILDACDEQLKPALQLSLCDLLFKDQQASQRLNQTAFTQPAIFALQWGLVELWKYWGIVPDIVLGHSVGEIAAACTAGMLDWQAGLAFSAQRGALMQSLPIAGGMLAVMESRQQVSRWIDEHQLSLSIAASNGPKNTVVSGTEDSLDQMITIARQVNCVAIRLNVSHAFHSELVHPILEGLSQEASKIAWRPSNMPFIANLTGEIVQAGATFTAEYLEAHARSEVCFQESIQTLVAWEPAFVVEIGPDTTLVDIARKSEGTERIQWNASLKRGRSAKQTMLSALGAVYEQGSEIHWQNVYPTQVPFVDLPKYPFQRTRYWESAPIATSVDTGDEYSELDSEMQHPLLGRRLDTQYPVFQNRLELKVLPWLADHRVADRIVFPGAAMVEMLNSALSRATGEAGSIVLETVRFLAPILVEPPASTNIQCTIANDNAISIASRQPATTESGNQGTSSKIKTSPWTIRCTARMATSSISDRSQVDISDFDVTRNQIQQGTTSDRLYQQLSSSGLEYGPEFRRLRRFILKDSEAWGEIQNTESDSITPWHFSPKTLDACFHLVAAILYGESDVARGKSYVPAGIDRIALMPCASHVVYCRASLASFHEQASNVVANLELFSDQGQRVGYVQGLQLVPSTFTTQPTQESSSLRVLQTGWRDRVAHDSIPIVDGEFVFVGADLETVELLKDSLVEAGHDWHGVTWESLTNSAESFMVEPMGKPLTLVFADDLTHRELNDADVWEQVDCRCRAMHLALNRLTEQHTIARIVLLTRGIQVVNQKITNGALPGSSLAGWFRALRLESLSWRCEHLDLDASISLESQMPIVARELQKSTGDFEIAIRDKKIWVNKLEDVVTPSVQEKSLANVRRNSRLSFSAKGSLDYLCVTDHMRPTPSAHEVVIRVKSTGLNFRDVLNVLGMYPGDAGPLGGECSGVIEEVGAEVTEFKIGDEVAAIASGSFAEYVSTPASLVAPKPKSLTFAEAASLPIVTLTAAIALRHFAKIKKGDRVLIHAAAGGVGLAAVRIALQAGAIVYATAGTPEKQQILKDLGAICVSSSRSQEFVEDFSDQLAGQRLDTILNSLSGEFIANSLRLLKPGGAFIEIGKIGIWEAAEVERQFPGTRYHPFDLAELSREQPEWIGSMLRLELTGYQSIQDRPRIVAFPINEAHDAFRYMAQAKQIGKIVITQTARRDDEKENLFSSSSSYIITGGLGSLGRQLISWMVQQGVKRIILPMHRPLHDKESEWMELLRNSDVEIVCDAVDMSSECAIIDWITTLESNGHSIRGFFHLAGKLSDSIVARMSWESYRGVLEAKAKIAWNFHNALRTHDLDYFVLFSSIASLLGSPGQANYAAANAFLDGLAERRRSQGLPATSLQWGPWEGEGMAADFQTNRQAWGVYPLSPETAFETLKSALHSDLTKVAVLRLDARAFSKTLGTRLSQSMVKSLIEDTSIADSNLNRRDLHEWRKRIEAANPSSARTLVAEFLKETALDVLRLPKDTTIDLRQPLNELGLDSLMAVEMQSLLSEVMQLKLDATVLFDHPTLEALERFLVKQWLARFEETTTATAREKSADGEPSEDESSTVDQIAKELAEELMLLRRREKEPR
jgi:acyl transferase domain-containing protein/NADPH:quinone reductase-like Zn-dependent oxidoreductase/acyl carrier protein/NADP-dependent 3-hydroxy acid dehydrogenase YdfG